MARVSWATLLWAVTRLLTEWETYMKEETVKMIQGWCFFCCVRTGFMPYMVQQNVKRCYLNPRELVIDAIFSFICGHVVIINGTVLYLSQHILYPSVDFGKVQASNFYLVK